MAIEAQRRAKPACMGSLYWQLNDCWPAASWSSIDYEGDPKALHYFARDAFGEVLVSPVVEDGVLRVYAVSDRIEAIEGAAILKLLDFSGNVIWIDSRRVSMSADSSISCAAARVTRWFSLRSYGSPASSFRRISSTSRPRGSLTFRRSMRRVPERGNPARISRCDRSPASRGDMRSLSAHGLSSRISICPSKGMRATSTGTTLICCRGAARRRSSSRTKTSTISIMCSE
jgi:hypothetical protein